MMDWFAQRRISRKKLRELEAAAKLLEEAAADAFAALWYSEHDAALKGASWGFASRQKAQKGLKIIRDLYRDP